MNRKKNDAWWALTIQLAIVLLLASILWVMQGYWVFRSFLLGGMISFVPNLILYRQMFRYKGASQAKQILKALYFGELLKLILTGAGFAVVLLLPHTLPLWVFGGFISALLSFWVAPIYRSLK